jgi:hypothetical protein
LGGIDVVWQSWKHVRLPATPRQARPAAQWTDSQESPAFAVPIPTQLVAPSSRTTLHVSAAGQFVSDVLRSSQWCKGMHTGTFVAIENASGSTSQNWLFWHA